MAIAFELGMDDEVVATWPVARLMRWNAFFKRKNELEKAALEKAEKDFEAKRKRKR